MLGWDGPHNGLVGNLSAVWWRWIAEVDLLRGAVDCRESAVGDFSWLCQGLVCVDMSTVYNYEHWLGCHDLVLVVWRVGDGLWGGDC